MKKTIMNFVLSLKTKLTVFIGGMITRVREKNHVATVNKREIRLQELRAILAPPPPELTELHHIAAYRKYLLEYLSDDLFYIWLIRTQPERFNTRTQEEVLSTLLNSLFGKKENKEEDEIHWPYGNVISLEEFKKIWGAELDNFHCGDCTAFAATCSRCFSEDLYGLPCSAKWNDKAEGYRLSNEYSKLLEEKEKDA